MSKNSKNKPSKNIAKQKPPANATANSQINTDQQSSPSAAWLSMRTGLIVMGVVSLGMAVMTAWQAIPIKGVLEGTIWGVGFGASLWLIFFAGLLINKFLRRN